MAFPFPFLLLLAADAATGGASARAPAPPSELHVAIVRIPAPWYAPQWLIRSKMRQTVATYEGMPGLAFKAYTIAASDGAFGGVYLWRDEASLRGHFSPQWYARVRESRGADPEVRTFGVSEVRDVTPGGTTEASATSATVITLERSASERHGSSGETGLLREYVLAPSAAPFRRIRMWADREHALAAGVREDDLSAEWFRAPIFVRNEEARGG